MKTQTTNNETSNLSMASCVKAISQSMSMARKALHLELAVCMAILGTGDNKKKLVEVYSKAGYDCENPNSRHYKTVNRRVNGAAAAFEKIGQAKVKEWMGELTDKELISAVGKGLEEFKFDNMDAVLEFAGKDSNRGRAAAETKKTGEGTTIKTGGEGEGEGAEEKEQEPEKVEAKVYRVNVGKVHLSIPEETSAQDLIKIAAKILKLGRDKEALELNASMGKGAKGAEIGAALH